MAEKELVHGYQSHSYAPAEGREFYGRLVTVYQQDGERVGGYPMKEDDPSYDNPNWWRVYAKEYDEETDTIIDKRITYAQTNNNHGASIPEQQIGGRTTQGSISLLGYPDVTYYSYGDETARTVFNTIPLFKNKDDYLYYVKTGDDSKAVNWSDVHPSNVDFYLTNNGDRITITYTIDKPEDSEDIEQLPFDGYRVAFVSDAIGTPDWEFKVEEVTYTTTWQRVTSMVVEIPAEAGLLMTLYVSIFPLRGDTKQGELQARITRKRGFLGDTTAQVVIGNFRNFNLHVTTDNEFDDIGEDGTDDSDAEGNDNDGSNFGGFSNLLATYQITKTALNDLGKYVWTNSIFDELRKINNFPLENIVSLMYMPVSIGGENTQIVLGNLNTNISGQRVSQNMKKVQIANFTFPKFNDGFLSYEPYTSCCIYLPLVGMVDLQPKDVMGFNVTIEYAFDVVCGSFGVFVYTSKGGGKTLIYSTQGDCSVTIPLTSSNKAQVQTAILQNGVSLVSDVATKNVGGAISDVTRFANIQNHSTTFGSASSMIGALSPYKCYYIVRTPITALPKNFAHTKGYLCMQTYKLKDLKGFTKLESSVDVSCRFSESGNQKLKDILTSGFYI